MYSIKFVQQLRQGVEDYEKDSIFLTEEDYNALPIIDNRDCKELLNGNCTVNKKDFFEQVRHATKSFPAIWISNPNWKLPNDIYVHNKIYFIFVCIDEKLDRWIAFKFYNLLTKADNSDAIIPVSLPQHGDIYRLNDDCMNIVRKFYN